MDDRAILYAIMVAVGGAIIWFFSRLGPAWMRDYESHPTAKEYLPRVWAILAALVRLAKAAQVMLRRRVNVLLVIEDQPFDATFLENLFQDVVAKHSLTLIVATSLTDSEPYLLSARAIILDVGLPDTELLEVQAFVETIFPPVIVHSVNEYTKEQFPSAAAIVKKYASADDLIRTVESVLASTYAKGRK